MTEEIKSLGHFLSKQFKTTSQQGGKNIMVETNKLRIENGMSLEEVMFAMCNGSYEAMLSVAEIFALQAGMVYLIELDILGIYGEELDTFWNEYCKRDRDNLETIMQAFYTDEYASMPAEEIRANLKQISAQILLNN